MSCVLACCVMAGCATRSALSDSDLQSARDKDTLGDLRVYVSDKTIPVYRHAGDPKQPGEIRRVISTKAAGLIVHEDDRDGAPRLWISFNPNCRAQDCAYGFVKNGEGYSLSDIPVREDYADTSVYGRRVKEEHRLQTDASGAYPVVLEIERSG